MTACIAHVALYVRDLEGMRAFYERALGAHTDSAYHNPNTGLSTHFLSFGGECRLELMHREDRSGAQERGRAGYAHAAFSLGSRAAVDEATAALQAAGAKLLSGPRVTGDGYYESLLQDPEGNELELTE